MNALTPQQKEDLRLAIIEVLAVRYPSAFPPLGITRRVIQDKMLDFDPPHAEVEAALQFLAEKNLVRFIFQDVGSTKHWSATADGVQKYERNQL